MSDVNVVVLSGRLGADPELKFSEGGKHILNMRLAVAYMDSVQWIDVTCFDKMAESLSKLLSKGKQVFVMGRLNVRSYMTKDGQKRTATSILASQVTLGSSPRGSETTSSSAPAESQAGDDGGPEF
jgi:single-strand DNA-binding protein